MARGKYITPDETGDSNIARCLSVPELLMPAVNGALGELMYASNWEQVGALTPQDCADAMFDVLSTYYESVCDVPQVYPENVAFFWNEATVITGNTLLAVQNQNALHDAYWWQSAAAINDEMWRTVLLRSGTYSLQEIVRTEAASGRQKWTVNTTAQTGFVEMYSAAATLNVVKFHTITIPVDGINVLKCKMDSKIAGSAGYANQVCWVALRRTGN